MGDESCRNYDAGNCSALRVRGVYPANGGNVSCTSNNYLSCRTYVPGGSVMERVDASQYNGIN